MLWRRKLSVLQGRKAASLKEAAEKEMLKKDPPMEKVSSSPLKLRPAMVNTTSDLLVDPKVLASPLPIASGPTVEQNLLPEPIAQSSPAVEVAPLLGASEMISLEQESPTQVKVRQAKSPLGAITGSGGDSSAPIGIEEKLHLLIKNTDPAQLALWEDMLDNSASNSLDDWCVV